MKRIYYAIIVIASLLSSCDTNSDGKEEKKTVTFEKIKSDHSGLSFSNTITPDVTSKANLFDYDYFYNGAGVSAVDINNDGLLDILLTANQEKNRLFLNKGNLKFEDITDQSGINQGKQWSNGVTTVDINKDGLMDFYISQGGPNEIDDRKNLLFVNNGDLTFSEQAERFGLADQGISTQSAFFDYDLDGDLDCIVMNESIHYGHDPVTFHRLLLEKREESYVSYTHLYRNDNGVFTDVTQEAGIVKPTFGLGLAISDINDDGYPDIYIANDYYLPDNLYINRKNGQFADRIDNHLKQTSFYGMGVDIADVNNDGHQDIYVLDMASKDHYRSKTLMASMDVPSFNLLTDQFGFIHQYMFNSFHLSDGQGRFNNIAHMTGLAKTDWSWAALMEDVDLDGDKDIFVSNGYRKYGLDNDFRNKVIETQRKYNGQVPAEVKEKLYDEMPTEPLANILYENKGDLQFNDIAKEIGLKDVTYSNGAIFADLDNDGDKDLIVNNIDQEVLLYKNNASSINNFVKVSFSDDVNSHLADVECWIGGNFQLIENRVVRGYRSSSKEDVLFGISDAKKVDSINIKWQDGTVSKFSDVKAGETVSVTTKSSKESEKRKSTSIISPIPPIALGLEFLHRENDYNDFGSEILLPQKQSTLGPCILHDDVDNDGDTDLFIGGARGQAAVIYLQQNGEFQKTTSADLINDAIHEDVSATLFDMDGDGDKDLYVVSGGNSESPENEIYKDRLYRNEGNGQFVKITNQAFIEETKYSGGVVKAFDFDNDGDNDLVIGQRIIPQNYPVAATSILLENKDGRFINVTSEKAPDLLQQEIINDIETNDIDGDGDQDMIVVGEWSGIRILENNNGSFASSEKFKELKELTGWWYSITPTDVNGDGRSDYIMGNVGSNMKHSASREKPFKVYAEDFDATGSIDIVLAGEYKGKQVPVRGRECSSQQMPFVAEKFETYDQFATASLSDIYGEDKLENAYFKQVVEFRSILLLSTPDGFDIKYLPVQSQMFPLLDAVSSDINGDGYDDIIAAGNIYNTEVETPRLDAGSGVVLLSNRKDGYQIGKCPEECLYIPGNVKDLEFVQTSKGSYLIAGVNDGPISMFSLSKG